MKQNFADVNVSELQAYVLANQEDEMTFQTLSDRLNVKYFGYSVVLS